ncbi:MAG: Rab family GTPase, partial [Candidatus Helarchaeota archaeon]
YNMNIEFDCNSLKPIIIFDVEILGDSQVGKKSIIEALLDYEFDGIYRDFLRKYNIESDKYLKSDLDYSEKRFSLKNFDCILRLYYHKKLLDLERHSRDGIILVFDVTRKITLYNLLKKWYPLVRNTYDEIPLIILGNKIDLNDKREVDKKAFKTLAKRLGVRVFETSAKYKYNIEKAMVLLLNDLLKLKKVKENKQLKEYLVRYKNYKMLNDLSSIESKVCRKD